MNLYALSRVLLLLTARKSVKGLQERKQSSNTEVTARDTCSQVQKFGDPFIIQEKTLRG